MTTWQIIDDTDDDLDDTFDIEGEGDAGAFGLDAEETLDFILDHPGDLFAFGEFEVKQEQAISRMKTIYGVFR